MPASDCNVRRQRSGDPCDTGIHRGTIPCDDVFLLVSQQLANFGETPGSHGDHLKHPTFDVASVGEAIFAGRRASTSEDYSGIFGQKANNSFALLELA